MYNQKNTEMGDKMNAYVQATEILRSTVPVSRFNKGEASKIFDEVAKTGIKIAMKNNKPACVLLSPEKFEAIMEDLEDIDLILEAERRLAELDAGAECVPFEQLLAKEGLTEADLEGWEDVEID